jgi:hypothetical protein
LRRRGDPGRKGRAGERSTASPQWADSYRVCFLDYPKSLRSIPAAKNRVLSMTYIVGSVSALGFGLIGLIAIGVG